MGGWASAEKASSVLRIAFIFQVFSIRVVVESNMEIVSFFWILRLMGFASRSRK